MNEKTEGANKIVTCGLLFTAQLFFRETRSAWRSAPLLPHSYWQGQDGRRSSIVLAPPACCSLWVGSLCIPISGSAVHLRRFRIRSLPIPRPRLLGYGFFVIVRLGELPSARWGIYTPISFSSAGFRVTSSSSAT